MIALTLLSMLCFLIVCLLLLLNTKLYTLYTPMSNSGNFMMQQSFILLCNICVWEKTKVWLWKVQFKEYPFIKYWSHIHTRFEGKRHHLNRPGATFRSTVNRGYITIESVILKPKRVEVNTELKGAWCFFSKCNDQTMTGFSSKLSPNTHTLCPLWKLTMAKSFAFMLGHRIGVKLYHPKVLKNLLLKQLLWLYCSLIINLL